MGMTPREQWVPVAKSDKRAYWPDKPVVTHGSEDEPASGFASVNEGGNPHLQYIKKPDGEKKVTGTQDKSQASQIDYKAAAERAEQAYGEKGPYWLND